MHNAFILVEKLNFVSVLRRRRRRNFLNRELQSLPSRRRIARLRPRKHRIREARHRRIGRPNLPLNAILLRNELAVLAFVADQFVHGCGFFWGLEALGVGFVEITTQTDGF